MGKISTKLLSIVAASLLAVSMAACSGGSTPGNAAAADPGATAADAAGTGADTQEEAAGSTGTVRITHEYGTVELAANPEKIVSFDLGILDILDTVGIEVGAMPSANFPEHLSKFREGYVYVGSMKEADFEAINEYAPDVILITGRMSASYEELSKIAPTVYFAMPGADYIDDFQVNVNVLAEIFPDKADDMQAKLDELAAATAALHDAARASGLKALIAMANDGNLSFFGSGSRYGLIHDSFGFAQADDDIDASTHGQESTFEYIYETNPDVLFIIDRSAAIGADGATGAASLLDNDLVNATTAAQNGKIIYLSSDTWYLATGGIHSTEVMIREVASALD